MHILQQGLPPVPGFTMVWKDERTVRAIIAVVINIPVLGRMLLKIGKIRMDFCHFMIPRHSNPSVPTIR